MLFLAPALRALVTICFIITLTACGGGGGGGGSGDTNPPPANGSSNPPPNNGNNSQLSQSVTFTASGPFTLTVGSSFANTASGSGTGAITYSSSNTNVATVDSNGVVTSIHSGTAVITATKAADSQFAQGTASYSVAITLAPQVITLGGAGPFSVTLGSTFFATATGLGSGANTYSSSNTSVAIVDSIGVVHTMSVGATTITITKAADSQYAQATASYLLYVTATPLISQTVAFAQAGPIALSAGDIFKNTAAGPGSGIVTYSSSNPAIATVDSTGTVTTIGLGTAQIIANKAADSQYAAATTAYTLNINSIRMTAWIGNLNTQVQLPAAANGFSLYRSSDENCNLISYASCADGQLDIVNGATINDSAATLSRVAYYTLKNNSQQTTVTISTQFPDHTGYQVTTFNNQLWMVGGYEGTSPVTGVKSDVWSSNDGFTWIQRTANGGFPGRVGHRVIAFNNKLWLIGGLNHFSGYLYYNDIWSSTDGVTWTQQTAHASFSGRHNHELVVFNNKLWLVGGISDGNTYVNDIWSSNDGINWTQEVSYAAFPARTSTQVVVFNNKLWLIAGGEFNSGFNPMSDIWSSADGTTWTQENANAAFGARSSHKVTVYNGRLWLVGGVGNSTPWGQGDVWSSSNGITWIQETANAAFNARSSFGLATFKNQLRVIGGCSDYPFCLRKDDSWYSTDGRVWLQQSTDVAFAGRENHRVVTFNNKLWLIGGREYSGGSKNDAWSSDDGLIWTQQGSLPSTLRRDNEAIIVFNNKLWFIGGQDNYNGSFNNDVWSSDDGSIWTRQIYQAAFSPRTAHQVVVYNNQLWLIGGYGSSNNKNDVWSSSDGVNWIQKTANAAFPARNGHQVVVYNNKLWLIGGQNSGYLNDVWSSNDGINWIQETASAAFPARYGHQVAVYNNKLWLIGGSANNDVWSSVDGVNWVQQIANAAFPVRTGHQVVIRDNQMLLIGGYAAGSTYKNDVWSSTDGIEWRRGFQRVLQFP